MEIKPIKRPWEKKSKYGTRLNPEPYYQSPQWKRLVNLIWIRDQSLCQICKAKGIMHPLERGTRNIDKQGTVDHKVQRINGGTDQPDNLWLIGSNHHASKSANEGNKQRKK
jgi:5-methylcytosine-specific restriction endonuclease McrA